MGLERGGLERNAAFAAAFIRTLRALPLSRRLRQIEQIEALKALLGPCQYSSSTISDCCRYFSPFFSKQMLVARSAAIFGDGLSEFFRLEGAALSSFQFLFVRVNRTPQCPALGIGLA